MKLNRSPFALFLVTVLAVVSSSELLDDVEQQGYFPRMTPDAKGALIRGAVGVKANRGTVYVEKDEVKDVNFPHRILKSAKVPVLVSPPLPKVAKGPKSANGPAVTNGPKAVKGSKATKGPKRRTKRALNVEHISGHW